MNIVEAIKCIKAQKTVRRASWSGDKFLYYVPAAAYPAVTKVAKSIANKEGEVPYKEYIAIHCKDGEVGFYTPTQCDILSNDWIVLS